MNILRLLMVVFAVHLTLFIQPAYTQDPLGIIKQLESGHPEMGMVTIKHDISISQLLDAYYIQNASKPGIQGFRIRIFFDLGPQSRNNSQDVMNEFMETYPGVAVYRTFDSPYYKISVGDFRTRDDALKKLKRIEKRYPKAFIISEWINFPPLTELDD